jgi:hypothetical protein
MFLTNSFVFQKTLRLAASPLAVGVAVNNSQLRRGYREIATSSPFSLAGQTVAMRRTALLSASVRTYAVAGITATLRRSLKLSASTRTCSIATTASALYLGGGLAAQPRALSISPQTAGLRRAARLTATAHAMSIATNTANLLKLLGTVEGTVAPVDMVPYAAQMRKASRVAATLRTYSIVGNLVNMLRGRRVTATSQAFAVSAVSTALKASRRLSAVARSFAVAGTSTTLTVSGGGVAPVVVSKNQGTMSGASTIAIPLPASIVAGNLLVVAAGWAGSGSDSAASGTISDWTLLGYVNPGTTIAYRRMKVWYKIADGSEGSTVNLNFSTTSAVAASSYQISGATSIAGFATENSVNVGSTSATPDPANLNLGSSAATLWLALCTKRQSSAMTSGPSGYTGFQTSSGTNMMGASAEKTSTAASEDPGVFTGSGADHWTCFTLGLR